MTVSVCVWGCVDNTHHKVHLPNLLCEEVRTTKGSLLRTKVIVVCGPEREVGSE